MKNFFNPYLSDEEWLIYERGWDKNCQGLYETLFSLGNGYWGIRGILEEIPEGATQGTFIAGIYDRSDAQTTEIVNLPDPIDLCIVVDDEKLDVNSMEVIEHKRILDMRNGILFRKTVFSDRKKRKYDYRSLRFLSADNEHLGIMRAGLTVLGSPVNLNIRDSINGEITNYDPSVNRRVKHTKHTSVDSFGDISCLHTSTCDKNIKICYGSHLKVGSESFFKCFLPGNTNPAKNDSDPNKEKITRYISLKLNRYDTVTLTKWAKKICYLLSKPKLAREMGRKGRKRVEKVFSKKRMAKDFISLSEELKTSD